MIEKEKNNDIVVRESQVPSSPVKSRPSLFQTVNEVKEQVEYQCFARELRAGTGKMYIDPLYQEICLIIAETYLKKPTDLIRIRGSKMEAAFVQEVYRKLRNEHLELVAENFKKQTHSINQPTLYLQTALYNVLFEFESKYTNIVNHDLRGME